MRDSKGRNRIVRDNQSDDSLSHVCALIEANYDRPLILDDIAASVHYSRFHFIRLFRTAYARTPHQYLMQRRIEKAKELLAATDLSVTEICLAVGFESLGSFSTLFRRYVGRAPQQYRRRIFAMANRPTGSFLPVTCSWSASIRSRIHNGNFQEACPKLL
jgi:AraC-like DNA-binding protein